MILHMMRIVALYFVVSWRVECLQFCKHRSLVRPTFFPTRVNVNAKVPARYMTVSSDFPNGGSVAKTREWLDKKGFKGRYVGWEAQALLNLEERDILSKFPLPDEKNKADMLLGLLKAAKETEGNPLLHSCRLFLLNTMSLTWFDQAVVPFLIKSFTLSYTLMIIHSFLYIIYICIYMYDYMYVFSTFSTTYI